MEVIIPLRNRNPINWGWFGTDLRQIRDIHSKFGEVKLKKYPLSEF